MREGSFCQNTSRQTMPRTLVHDVAVGVAFVTLAPHRVGASAGAHADARATAIRRDSRA
jgi:hypothetical protein